MTSARNGEPVTTNPADHPTERHESGRPKQYIQLTNPVVERIPGFAFANAVCRICGKVPLPRKDRSKPIDGPVCQCKEPKQLPVVRPDLRTAENVMICGSGPSLRKSAKMIRKHPEADVWGCNEALTWLVKKGYRVTHGLCIDQSPDHYEYAWVPPPDVTYYLATTVDWRLVEFLEKHGFLDQIYLWHSYNGFDGEYALYNLLYPETALCGNGLNVCNRSIALAEYMGYETIWLLGTDCALGSRDTFHVYGDKEDPKSVILRGTIDGRRWSSKPDMLYSALDIVQQKRRLGTRLRLVGDTLPKALQHKDDAFLERLIRWVAAGEMPQAEGSTNRSELTNVQIVP